MKSSIAYLLAPALGYFVAQACKYVLATRQHKTWKEWFRSGKMPSSHSAVVVALVAVIFFNEGITPLFSVATVFALIIMYDALVARRSIGEQGEALVEVMKKVPSAKVPFPRVALGHKPLEVVVGSALGLVAGLIVAFFITK